MQYRLSVLALLLLCSVLVGCRGTKSSGAAEDQSPVIVQINGAAERQAAFERFVKARLSDFAQGAPSQSDNDQLRSRLLDEFIRRQLIVQEASQKKIEPTDDEIRTALEAQHKQTSSVASAGGEGAGQNQATLESSERRVEIFNDLLTLKFYKTEVLKDVQITPQEIEAYYQQHSAQYQGKDGFYVREIRVHEEANAQQLYRQAMAKPDDFPVLARENSEAPTAANGGLIYYEAQQLPAPLEQAITPLKVGSISKVVKSSYGFHIFKLEQRAEPLPLDKVRKEIEDKLLSAKNQTLIDEYNRRALSNAKIVVHRDRLGFNYVGQLGAGS
jgi:parvulin-like peptidyl-prolyl isomerase